MSEGWSTIESEPAVFHQLIREFGVSGVSVSYCCVMRDLRSHEGVIITR